MPEHDWPGHVRRRLGDLSAGSAAEREQVVEELASHLEQAYEDGLVAGRSEDDALADALEELPSRGALERALGPPPNSPRRRGSLLADFGQDLRYGLRGLAKSPVLSGVIVSVLAIGIGGAGLATALIHSLLLRPLPVPDAHDMVRIYGSSTGGLEHETVSYPDFLDLRRLDDVFAGVLAYKLLPVNVATESRQERLWGNIVSGEYFRVLGIEPAVGRFFLPEEDTTPGSHPVAVLGYGLWQRSFGGRESVIDESVLLDGQPFTIVGVAPRGFSGTDLGLQPEIWVPMMMQRELLPGLDYLERRGTRGHFAMARLRPGVELDQARSALDLLARQLEEQYPDSNRGIGFSLLPEVEGGLHPMMRSSFAAFLGVFGGVVLLLLLLACANVSGLLVARASARRSEMGLRLALGAGRSRLLRQLLTESLLLASAATVLGLLGVRFGLAALAGLDLPLDLPIRIAAVLEARVVLFTGLLALLTVLVFGLAPALQATRSDLSSPLREARGGRERSRLRSVLAASQIAFSTMLLIGAGLFLRSLANSESADVGFRPEGLALVSVDTALQGYDDPAASELFRQLEARLRSLPGVAGAALASSVPFDFNINRNTVAPEGYVVPEDGSVPSIDYARVGPGYFATLGAPLLAGREFTLAEATSGNRVVIVNRTLARRFWPDGEAVGKRLGMPGRTLDEVIGVVGDGKYLALGEAPKPYIYYPFRYDAAGMTAVVRASGDPAAVLPGMREAVAALDSTLPVYGLKTMDEHLQIALAPARAGALLLGGFGLLALLLATTGLYGLMAFTVTERRREIGIRRALGARHGHILGMVTRHGLLLVLAGAAVGLAASAGLARLLVAVLYDTQPYDPQVFVLVPVLLAGVALVGCLVPALRAFRLDPAATLHHD